MKHFGKIIQAGVALAVLDLCRQIWFVYTGQSSVISLVFSLIAFAAVNLLLILLNFAAFRSFTTEAETTVENQAVPAAEASIQTS